MSISEEHGAGSARPVLCEGRRVIGVFTMTVKKSQGKNLKEKGDTKMEWNFWGLNINKLIIHEVPKKFRIGDANDPIYSEIESPLENDLIVFFRIKIIDSVGSSFAYDVSPNLQSTSPIPILIKSYLRES